MSAILSVPLSARLAMSRRCALVVLLSCAFLLVASASACANTLAINAQNPDLMDDSNTGLEWLNLTETDGMSYDQVTAAITNPSSPLYGFSVASASQTQQLYIDAGIPANVTSQNYTINSPYAAAITNLTNLWGPYYQANEDYYWANAMVTDHIAGSYQEEATAAYDPNYNTTIFGNGWFGLLPTGWTPDVGTALIRAVPEPGTLALLGIGAVSLLAYAWRKRGAA
jgi:hypothetical protein